MDRANGRRMRWDHVEGYGGYVSDLRLVQSCPHGQTRSFLQSWGGTEVCGLEKGDKKKSAEMKNDLPDSIDLNRVQNATWRL